MAGRIKIIAVGNPLRGDDGVGPAVLERLRETRLPENVELIDSGSDPLDVVRHIMDAERAIVIDAAGMNREPGHIELLKPEDLRLVVNGGLCSTHGYGLAEGLELARAVGFRTDVLIIGIQPENVSPRDGLSASVASRIPDVINLVLEEVAS